MKTPSYHSEPHVTYLSQLLVEIRDGAIQVPKFQRPLVWRKDDRLELLRSIRDGIPMGAVMVWRSSGPLLECYENLGPFRLKQPNAAPQYLLDGVQRLSTLLGALSPVEMIDADADEFVVNDGDPPTENFAVYYDFELDDFLIEDGIRVSPNSTRLPLNLMLDSVGMLKFQRKLLGTEDEVDAKVRICDKLSAAFREYKVPVIPIVTDDVGMATRTFQRLNSQGKPMSEAHMIHALSWGEGFDLNSSIKNVKILELTKFGWADIDDDVLLKACKIALGFGVYSKNTDEIGNAFKEKSSVVDEVGRACGAAVKFLVNRCSIIQPDLLPYSFQLILLTNAFRSMPNLTNLQLSRLVSWFWSTTYCEYFAGMSGDRVEKARQDLERGLTTDAWDLTSFGPFEVKKLNRKFDFRSVRAKAFALRLAELNQYGSPDQGLELLNAYGREALMQLLPRTSSQNVIYSSYANRFLIDPIDVATFKEKIVSQEFEQHELESLIISPDMIAALADNDHPRFVTLREEKIFEVEKEFYQEHLLAMGINVNN